MIPRAYEDIQGVSRLPFREISFSNRTSDAWSVTTSATLSRARICSEAGEYLAQAVLRCDNMRDIVAAAEEREISARGISPGQRCLHVIQAAPGQALLVLEASDHDARGYALFRGEPADIGSRERR